MTKKSSIGNIARGRYASEAKCLRGEIDYLSTIEHPRHKEMIQKRKQRLKIVEDKLRLGER